MNFGLVAFWIIIVFSLLWHGVFIHGWIVENEYIEYIEKKKEAIMFCIPIFGIFYLLYLVVSKKMKDLP